MAEAKAKKVSKTKIVKETDVAKTDASTAKQTKDIIEEKPNNEPVAVAKAGKRSTKAIAETEEKIAKEERKAAAKVEDSDDKPKKPVKPARSLLERRGKKYREAANLIETGKIYSVAEALELATKTSTTKFDATVELHVRLGVDPRQADQNLRDNIVLPAGTGKTVRVAVFADEETAKTAKKAGADVAGDQDFLTQLDKGTINFDVLIATPSVMARLSKYARVLGPKGLMPNPKSGTVTTDVVKAVSQAKAGKVEYRVDSTGIVHLGIGKVSFGTKKLNDNIQAVIASIKQNKPASLKGIYVRSITVTTSMGPSIKVATSEI